MPARAEFRRKPLGTNLRPRFGNITLRLNLSAPFFLAQALVPEMMRQGWGRIINIASLQSSRAFPNGLPYGASKAGIAQLTRGMAEAWSRPRSGHHGQRHRAGLLQDAAHRPALRQAGSRRGSRPANHYETGGLRGRYSRVDHVPRFPRVRLYHGAGHPHRWRLDRHIGESQRAE